MDHEASVAFCMLIAQALQSSTTQLASYAAGLSTDSPRTFGIAIYMRLTSFSLSSMHEIN